MKKPEQKKERKDFTSDTLSSEDFTKFYNGYTQYKRTLKKIDFDDIDLDFYGDFVKYLETVPKVNGKPAIGFQGVPHLSAEPNTSSAFYDRFIALLQQA